MPTYQYQCTACREGLEAVQKFTDDALTDCPACGGRLRKVYSAVGVVFKGSGFYRTDSRSAASSGSPVKEPAKAGAGADAASSSGGSSSEGGAGGSSATGSGTSGSASSSSDSGGKKSSGTAA